MRRRLARVEVSGVLPDLDVASEERAEVVEDAVSVVGVRVLVPGERGEVSEWVS